jgi:cysteine desulfurase
MNCFTLVSKKRLNIYFDNAATTRLDNRVLQAMLPYFTDKYGNASSNHSYGTETKEILWYCKKTISGLLNCLPEEIIFTSGGTESNNMVLKGVAFANSKKGNHFIVSSIEHECVLNTCKWLEKYGIFTTYLPVDSYGFINPEKLLKYINQKTALISVMHANNEIGTVQDIEQIGKICREKGVLFHTDACQSFGKLPLDVVKDNIDLLTMNSHKIYGPKGAGALYIKRGTIIEPLLHGGGQENGLRSTTENIPGIVGFTEAAKIAYNEMQDESIRLKKLRDKIIQSILKNIKGSYLNGHPDKRLSENVNIGIQNLEGETMKLILLLDEDGIAVSGGSACSSNSTGTTSHVLQAIGRDQFESRGAIRISLGRFNTEKEVDDFLEILFEKINQLKPILI